MHRDRRRQLARLGLAFGDLKNTLMHRVEEQACAALSCDAWDNVWIEKSCA
jgi:hypothetical protein